MHTAGAAAGSLASVATSSLACLITALFAPPVLLVHHIYQRVPPLNRSQSRDKSATNPPSSLSNGEHDQQSRYNGNGLYFQVYEWDNYKDECFRLYITERKVRSSPTTRLQLY